MTKLKPPVRMRGYYRALNNKSSPHHDWADKIDAIRRRSTGTVGYMHYALALTYRCSHMSELFYKDNPFMSLIPKKGWGGSYVPVPIKFGKD